MVGPVGPTGATSGLTGPTGPTAPTSLSLNIGFEDKLRYNSYNSFNSTGYIYDDCGVFNYYNSNILPLDANLNTNNLIPVKYRKINGSTITFEYGLIANKSLTDVVPNLVNQSNGIINYNALFGMVVNEIHQLRQQLYTLNSRL